MAVAVIDRLLRAALLVLALAFVQAPARADPPIPPLTGRVVDDAHILDSSIAATIDTSLAGYEQATSNQVVVVTLTDLKGYTIEEWGLALGRGWGIGQKGKDNGVLLIVAPNDHAVRVEVGYGLEGTLPDAIANEIVQSVMIPHFKAGDLSGGVQAGVTSILSALDGDLTAAFSPPSRKSSLAVRISEAVAPLLPFVLMILLVMLMSALSALGRVRYGLNPVTKRYGWYLIPDTATDALGSGSTSHGFGGGFAVGGGFSAGGGFSGGGGSFGGGGASGHW